MSRSVRRKRRVDAWAIRGPTVSMARSPALRMYPLSPRTADRHATGDARRPARAGTSLPAKIAAIARGCHPPKIRGQFFDGPHEGAVERPGAPWAGGAAGCKGQHRAARTGGIAAPQAQRSSAPRPPTPAGSTREATPMTTGMHTVTDWSPGDAGLARKFRPAFSSCRRTSHRKDHVRPRLPTRRLVPLRGLPSRLSPGRRDHLHTWRASRF